MGRVLARPALIGLYYAVQLGSDRVEVCNAGRSVVLTAAGNAEALVVLLHALDGTASVDQLEARFPNLKVRTLIDALDARGVLTDAGEPDAAGTNRDPGGRLRTVSAISDHAAPAGAAKRLHEATILFDGCGPVAAATAVALAKAGIGRIVLADELVVSDKDVIACPVLSATASGHRRVDAIAGACAGMSHVRVEAHATADARLDGATVAVIQCQYGESGMVARFGDVALRAGVPYLVHLQDALEMVIGPVIARGGRPCHRCMEARRLSHVAHLDEHLAYVAHRSEVAPEPDSYLAAHTMLAAGLLSARVLQHVTGTLPDDERSTVLALNLAASEWRREVVLEVPGCAACRDAAA